MKVYLTNDKITCLHVNDITSDNVQIVTVTTVTKKELLKNGILIGESRIDSAPIYTYNDLQYVIRGEICSPVNNPGNITEIVDLNFQFRPNYDYKKFNNDTWNEFKKILEQQPIKGFCIPVVRIKQGHLYDPTSDHINIKQLVSHSYFVSDNGYICDISNYHLVLEKDKRRKYILL